VLRAVEVEFTRNIGIELAAALEPPGEGPLGCLDIRGIASRIDVFL